MAAGYTFGALYESPNPDSFARKTGKILIFDAIIPFIITCVLIELTPGPNMTYIALVSTMHGRKAGFSIVAGVACGLFLIGLVALGGASLILQKDGLYETLRWAGVLYLLWLAYDLWRNTEGQQQPQNTNRRYFIRGLVTNILNPKAVIFYVTVFPSYVTREGNLWLHFLPLIALYVGVATVIHVAIVLFGAKLEPFFNDKRREKYSRIFFTVSLIAVAVWVAFATAR